MVKVASDLGHSPQHTKAASFIRSLDFSRSACCALTGTGGFTITTEATSSRPAVTLSQSSPGRGTTTVRSRSTPNLLPPVRDRELPLWRSTPSL